MHHTGRPLIALILTLILSSCAHVQAPHQESSIHDMVAESNASYYFDERIWYQNIYAEVNNHRIVLRGESFFERPVHGLIKKLRKAGVDHAVLDSITYLPETFDDGLAYGIITATYTMGRKTPVLHKQEGTEMLYGEPVRLIRKLDNFVQVQSSVGYLGYIPKNDVRFVDLEEWNTYQQGKQALFSSTIELESGQTIQMGTRLPYLEEGNILLPDGQIMMLSDDQFKIIDPAKNPLRQDIVASSKQYLGLPYVWGGRSADGVDCSGFVMQSFALNNIYLPRDTDEMANVGRVIGFPGWTEVMLPGDLLFFAGTRRLVTHTAIYLGDGKVIHSLGSGVQIQSMNPEDEDYAESLIQRFIFAKRIFE